MSITTSNTGLEDLLAIVSVPMKDCEAVFHLMDIHSLDCSCTLQFDLVVLGSGQHHGAGDTDISTGNEIVHVTAR